MVRTLNWIPSTGRLVLSLLLGALLLVGGLVGLERTSHRLRPPPTKFATTFAAAAAAGDMSTIHELLIDSHASETFESWWPTARRTYGITGVYEVGTLSTQGRTTAVTILFATTDTNGLAQGYVGLCLPILVYEDGSIATPDAPYRCSSAP